MKRISLLTSSFFMLATLGVAVMYYYALKDVDNRYIEYISPEASSLVLDVVFLVFGSVLLTARFSEGFRKRIGLRLNSGIVPIGFLLMLLLLSIHGFIFRFAVVAQKSKWLFYAATKAYLVLSIIFFLMTVLESIGLRKKETPPAGTTVLKE